MSSTFRRVPSTGSRCIQFFRVSSHLLLASCGFSAAIPVANLEIFAGVMPASQRCWSATEGSTPDLVSMMTAFGRP